MESIISWGSELELEEIEKGIKEIEQELINKYGPMDEETLSRRFTEELYRRKNSRKQESKV